MEWEVFYTEEPWGFEAEAFALSQIAATVANSVPRETGCKVFKATDFYREPWVITGEGLTAEQRAFIEERKRKKANGSSG